eukprot:g17771.t1
MSDWVCQHPACSASEEQLAELRLRRPNGFAHDEDPSLQVCTDAWPVLGFGPLMDGGAAARVTGGRGEESPFRLHMGSWKMQWMLLWLGRR